MTMLHLPLSLRFLFFLWLMGGFLEANASPAPAQCDTVYAIYDEGVSNTQFFTYQLQTDILEPLGELYKKADIEGLAVHPQTHELYARSGQPNAQFYRLDGQTGALSHIGNLGYDNVVALAFHPNGTLFGWATQGLLQIDLDTGAGSLLLASEPSLSKYSATPLIFFPLFGLHF